MPAGKVGGAYEIVNAAGDVLYVGETNDFDRRLDEHRGSDRFFGINIKYGEQLTQGDYDVRRGLEQELYNDQWGDVEIADAKNQGSLNRQRPIASRRTDVLQTRGAFARAFKKIC